MREEEGGKTKEILNYVQWCCDRASAEFAH